MRALTRKARAGWTFALAGLVGCAPEAAAPAPAPSLVAVAEATLPVSGSFTPPCVAVDREGARLLTSQALPLPEPELRVELYARDGTEWAHEASWSYPVSDPGPLLGDRHLALAGDGTRAVVHYFDGEGERVEVHRRDDDGWVEEATLPLDDLGSVTGVAIDDDGARLAVDTRAPRVLRFFAREGLAWRVESSVELPPPTAGEHRPFLSRDGARAVVQVEREVRELVLTRGRWVLTGDRLAGVLLGSSPDASHVLVGPGESTGVDVARRAEAGWVVESRAREIDRVCWPLIKPYSAGGISAGGRIAVVGYDDVSEVIVRHDGGRTAVLGLPAGPGLPQSPIGKPAVLTLSGDGSRVVGLGFQGLMVLRLEPACPAGEVCFEGCDWSQPDGGV